MAKDGVGLNAHQRMLTAQSQLPQACREQRVIRLISGTLEAVNTQMQALLNHSSQLDDRNLFLKHLHEGIVVGKAVGVGLWARAQHYTGLLFKRVAVKRDLSCGDRLGNDATVLPHAGAHVHHAVRPLILDTLETQIDLLEVGNAHRLLDVIVHLLAHRVVQLHEPVGLIGKHAHQRHNH